MVAAIGDALGLVEAVERHRPDVCVVDVRMPPSFQDEGLRAALEIRGRWPGTPVLVLSQYVGDAMRPSSCQTTRGPSATC